MDEAVINAVFQPRPSRQETKADATNHAARAIIESEVSAREAKTERLRAARLAQEAAEPPAAPATKRTRRKG